MASGGLVFLNCCRITRTGLSNGVLFRYASTWAWRAALVSVNFAPYAVIWIPNLDVRMDTVDPEEGDFFEGVLLETCRDDRVTRPRVRPVEVLPEWLRVEFPRDLREKNPMGTRFRADVHVRRKHHDDGRPNGDVYLRAENSSIVQVEQPDTDELIFARKRHGTVSGKSYEYIRIKRAPKSAVDKFIRLRRRAYGKEYCRGRAQKLAEVMRHERSRLMAEYALSRSSGVCEGCFTHSSHSPQRATLSRNTPHC